MTPRQVARKIAARHGQKPKTITVKMVGTKDVQQLLSRVEAARKASLKSNWQLD